MTDFLEDDGSFMLYKGADRKPLSDAVEITPYTDSASSADASWLWNSGYQFQNTADYYIEFPVTEVGSYKAVAWFSNKESSTPSMGERPFYLGSLKMHYTHSGGAEQTVTQPNGTTTLKPWSWYYSSTALGDPDYAGNEDDGTGSYTDYGPWKSETPSFTVTSTDENVKIRLEVSASVFLSAFQLLDA